MNFCPECGEGVNGAKFCPKCGKSLLVAPQEFEPGTVNPEDLSNPAVQGLQPHQTPTFGSPTGIVHFLGVLWDELTKQSKVLGLDIDIGEFEKDFPRALTALMQHEIDHPAEVHQSVVFKIRDLYSDDAYLELDRIRSAVLKKSGDLPRADDIPGLLHLGEDYCHSPSLYTIAKWMHSQSDLEKGFNVALWAIATAFSATDVLSPALWGIAQPWAAKFTEASSKYEAGTMSADEFVAFCDQHRVWIGLASVCIRWSLQRIVFEGDSAEDVNISHEIWRSDTVYGAQWLRQVHSRFGLSGKAGGHPGAVAEALGYIWEFGVAEERVEAEQTLRNLTRLWADSSTSATRKFLLESYAPAQKYLRAL